MSRERFFFLDLLKAISVISVVSFHSIFVPLSTYKASAPTLDIAFSPLRFCVPMLLLISFFLLERSIQNSSLSKSELIKKKMSRLATPTVFWFSISAIIDLVGGNPLGKTLYQVLIGEAFIGAYYLLVLFQLVPLAICVTGNWAKSNLLVVTIIGLQILIFSGIHALAADSSEMANTLYSLTFVRAFGRSPIVYWIVYIALGGWVHRQFKVLLKLSHRLSPAIKLTLLGSLAVSFMVEYAYLAITFNHSVPPFEYLTLSCLLSSPIVFLCCMDIQAQDLPQWLQSMVITLSRYSLGIFCINGTLARIFIFLGATYFSHYTFTFTEILAIKLVSWFALLLVSLIGSMALSRVGLKAVVC